MRMRFRRLLVRSYPFVCCCFPSRLSSNVARRFHGALSLSPLRYIAFTSLPRAAESCPTRGDMRASTSPCCSPSDVPSHDVNLLNPDFLGA